MTIHIGADIDDGPFADDMRLATDLHLIAELADQAAQGALISYGVEDWQRSPLGRMLEAAATKLHQARRTLPSSVVEARQRFAAARTEAI